MKSLVLLFVFFSTVASAQFEVEELKYTETYYYEGMITGSDENQLCYLSSEKNPELAKRINDQIYLDIFGKTLNSAASVDSLFPVYDAHSKKEVFRYEVLENSNRFFTVHVSYKRPYKEVRSHRYYTFLSTNGALKDMSNLLFDEDKYEEMAHRVYAIYAKELDEHIGRIDTTGGQNLHRRDVLVECAENYFTETYRLEYGFLYLTDAGVHFINPFCPDRDGVRMLRRDWFQTVFTYDEVADLMPVQMLPYVETGKWELTNFEKLERVSSGTVNGKRSDISMYNAFDQFRGFYCYFDYPGEENLMQAIIRVKEDGVTIEHTLVDETPQVTKLKVRGNAIKGKLKLPEETLKLEFVVDQE